MMNRINDFPKTDDSGTTREPHVAGPNADKKSEFCRKKPLPSISIEKDPEFAESLLCAATMHIRQKTRESTGSSTPRPQCPGHVLVPRTKDIPKPGTGRRSPPIPPGPTQGPCGDLPPRKTTDGIHKRDSHNQCDNHLLLNPPWRATCAIVEPTQAGNICLERLPRGLKQPKIVDLCHRHGHRRRLEPLEETQNADAAQKRGRPVMQRKANGSKQRGDFNAKKVIIEKNTFNTIAEEQRHRQGSDDRTKTDNSFGEDNKDMTMITGCKATEDLKEERPEDVTLDEGQDEQNVSKQGDSDEDIILQSARCGTDDFDHKLSETTCKTTVPSTHENIIGETEDEETTPDEACLSKEDVETSDTALCRTMPSKPTLVKAESLTFRRTTGKLHTDERPNSFTALTAKVKELEHVEETTSQPTTGQPLSGVTIHEKVQANDNVITSADDHSDYTPDDKGDTICHDSHRNDNILESCLNEHQLIPCPQNIEEGPCTADEVSAFDQPETFQDSKKYEITEIQSKRTGDLNSSACEDKPDGLLDDKVQVPLETDRQSGVSKHAENIDEASIYKDQSLSMQSDKSCPISESNSRTTQEESIRENRESELLSFSVDSPRMPRNENWDCVNSNQSTPTTDDSAEKQESPIGQFKDQDAKNTGLEAVNLETIRQRPKTDMPSQNETRETEVSVQISQKSENFKEPSPHLQRSLSCHDLAIDVRFFKTPDNDTNDGNCFHHGESPSLGSGSRENSDGSYKNERCTIRKIHSHDNSGKCKYIVLPDQDRVISDVHGIPIKPLRIDNDKDTQRDTCESASDRQSLLQNPSEIPTDGIKTTSREKNITKARNITSDPRIDPIVSKLETVEGSSVLRIDKITDGRNNEQETCSRDDNRETTDENHDLILSRQDQLRNGIGRRARRKTECDMHPIQEDETVDSEIVNDQDANTEGFQGQREDGGGKSGIGEEEWFPLSVHPLPQPTAANVSGPPPKQPQPKRINFAESNRFLRIHGNYLQGDGPWGHGDRIERPRNYVEPNVSLDDMSLRFFTDITPLDLAFNAINVVNSCSNSISYHSCINQKRLLAALDGLKHDDVYKHALICPLALQCATATREFSQALHKVFRRFSNRARAAQEALLEYYRALAAGEVNSPEMLRQIQRDGRRLYMVWEGGRYVTKYSDDAIAELSNSSSDTSTRPSASDPAEFVDNESKE
ncbi:uncharacterized protein LOC119729608 [Patiria miniata]|uniref:Uncharacterized protein n=1 Tax=Patiria miniata TaxID=46514 RepID=A0A914A472_PATMI|nr:uncharacterized protein LOC119729608 [Patiria miniata]